MNWQARLLFLVAYQWEVGGLFFLFIMVFVFANRRWGVSGRIWNVALYFACRFISRSYPGWGLPYIRAVLSDLVSRRKFEFQSYLVRLVS